MNTPTPQGNSAADDLAAARATLDVFCSSADNAARIDRVGEVIASLVRAGGRILACGNGGSAADAMHFCEELTGRYREDRASIGAVACTDPGYITCAANDYGFDRVFARWVEGVARPGDVLVVLSTSGNSPNVARAVDAARQHPLTTVALLGKDGGAIRGCCDYEWVVPGDTADRIQEIHMLILHALVGAIERQLFTGNPRSG